MAALSRLAGKPQKVHLLQQGPRLAACSSPCVFTGVYPGYATSARARKLASRTLAVL